MKNIVVIAEAGVNHNGDLNLGLKLIDAAAAAGSDFVKFQSFKAENLVTETAEKADYQKENTGNNDSQFSMLKKLEMNLKMQNAFIERCKEKNIMFLSTPFDEEMADQLEEIVPLFKIPSGELTNLPFIEHLAKKKKPIILSTGMASLEEVKESVDLIRSTWKSSGYQEAEYVLENGKKLPSLIVLHCTTAYPTPMNQVNLLAMKEIEREVKVPVGYSDHTLGIEVPIASAALGACLIEKHFTLDREMEGPDHKASLEPQELIDMCSGVRNISEALGDGKKQAVEIEKVNIAVARKSIHYSKSLEKGDKASLSDFVMKRPGGGLAPKEVKELVGKVMNIAAEKNQIVTRNDFQ